MCKLFVLLSKSHADSYTTLLNAQKLCTATLKYENVLIAFLICVNILKQSNTDFVFEEAVACFVNIFRIF